MKLEVVFLTNGLTQSLREIPFVFGLTPTPLLK